MINNDHLTAIATRVARHVSATTGQKFSVAEVLMNIEVIDRCRPLPYRAMMTMDDAALTQFLVLATVATMIAYEEEFGGVLQ